VIPALHIIPGEKSPVILVLTRQAVTRWWSYPKEGVILNRTRNKQTFIVIVSRSNFQDQRAGEFYVDKIDHVLQRLAEQEKNVHVMSHLESPRLPKKISYPGSEQHRSLRRFLVLILATLSIYIFQHGLGFDGRLSALRQSWLSARTKTWQEIFRREGALAVLGIGLTESEILAARKLGIPTMELQHGMFFDSDIHAYWPTSTPSHFALWGVGEQDFVPGFGMDVVLIPPPQRESIQNWPRPNSLLVPLSNGTRANDPIFGCLPDGLELLIEGKPAPLEGLVFRAHPLFSKSRQTSLKRKLMMRFGESTLQVDSNLGNFLNMGLWVLLSNSTVWLDALRNGNVVLTNSDYVFARLKALLPGGQGVTYFFTPDLQSFSDSIGTVMSQGNRPHPSLGAIRWSNWDAFDSWLSAVG
jgi:hypothetical protein